MRIVSGISFTSSLLKYPLLTVSLFWTLKRWLGSNSLQFSVCVSECAWSQIELLVLLVEGDLIEPDLLVDFLDLPLALFDHLHLLAQLLRLLHVMLILHFLFIGSIERLLSKLGVSLGELEVLLLDS